MAIPSHLAVFNRTLTRGRLHPSLVSESRRPPYTEYTHRRCTAATRGRPKLEAYSSTAERKWDDAWFFIEKNGVDLDGYRALIRALKGDREEALRVARKRDAAGADPLVVARLFIKGGDRASAV